MTKETQPLGSDPGCGSYGVPEQFSSTRFDEISPLIPSRIHPSADLPDLQPV